MKLTGRNWTSAWAVAGLLVPVILILRYYFFGHYGFGTPELVLWPSSILLMGLEGQRSRVVITVVYAIAIGANVVLYGLLGLLGWRVFNPILRRRFEKLATNRHITH